MATAADVAAYILGRTGPITAMKLQKLVYYSQAWSLVWDEAPLFAERIEAWANGPVCPPLYERHKGSFQVVPETLHHAGWRDPDPSCLSKDQIETIEIVLSFYGKMSAQQLSDLTHAEKPWRQARGALPDGESSTAEITHESMAEYYAAVQASLDAKRAQ